MISHITFISIHDHCLPCLEKNDDNTENGRVAAGQQPTMAFNPIQAVGHNVPPRVFPSGGTERIPLS